MCVCVCVCVCVFLPSEPDVERRKALGEEWNFAGQAVEAGSRSLSLRIGVPVGLRSMGVCVREKWKAKMKK